MTRAQIVEELRIMCERLYRQARAAGASDASALKAVKLTFVAELEARS